MPPPDRFEILAPLPSAAGFRRALAIERGGAPRAVVLQFPPARVADDPARLATLVRDAETAARVHHAHTVTVVGLETVGDALVNGFLPAAPLLCLKRIPACAVTSVNSISPAGRGGVGLGDGEALACACSP